MFFGDILNVIKRIKYIIIEKIIIKNNFVNLSNNSKFTHDSTPKLKYKINKDIIKVATSDFTKIFPIVLSITNILVFLAFVNKK